MLNRRFKRILSLAISLCTIALFVVNLRLGRSKQEPWGMLLTRGPSIHDKRVVQIDEPILGLSSAAAILRAAEGDTGRYHQAVDEDPGTDLVHHQSKGDEPAGRRNDSEADPDTDADADTSTDTNNEIHDALADDDTENSFLTSTVDPTTSDVDDGEDGQYSPLPEAKDYREVFSLTSSDRKFYSVYLGGDVAYNPSVIPHPTRHDLWIVVAQHEQSNKDSHDEEALTCTAGFFNGALVCTAPPTVLPITKSIEGRCEGDIEYFNLRGGPRDARIFHGPDAPYIIYGSQASYTCMGLWLQDLRMLLQDFRLEQMTLVKLFKKTTELQRPPSFKEVEKNFFLFWDSENKAYVHHDIYPTRVFAQLSYDGSVGPDLAPSSATRDGICMAKYMPTLESGQETIHQATNSLSITLCQRNDPFCVPNDSNTFIMTIFQHKSYYDYHSIYEPYVMLFQRTAPFAIHAISQRPLWIHGREQLTTDTHAIVYDLHPDRVIPEGHSEMFYITSISWKTHGQRYHGYIDDPLFLTFGIEDTRPAIVDVTAGDLLQDLGYCSR